MSNVVYSLGLSITSMNTISHCVVVPAYGQSPYLRDCLASLAAQTRPSPVLVCTSTPFDGMDALCDQFGARVMRHSPNRGIAHDWNVALAQARGEWVTIAHQDDVYLPRFVERTVALVERHPGAILAFTDYEEMDNDGVRPRALPLRVKRWLIECGMWGREHAPSRWSKTNLLRFGCAIGCPTVSLRRTAVPEGIKFEERYRVNLDWDFWLKLAQETPGSFVSDRSVLMRHRIHDRSETTAGILDGVRAREDQELFSRMWPGPVAKMLARAYGTSYSYNRS